ncbi:MAG: DNA-processing protein DprA [Acidobacteriota bacterium]
MSNALRREFLVSNKKQPTLFDIESIKPIEENKICLLAFANVEGLGFATITKLFDIYRGDLYQAWRADFVELLFHLKQTKVPNPQNIIDYISINADALMQKAREHYGYLKNRNISILFRGNNDYPRSLEALPTAPAWIFVEGDISLLVDPGIVAVVGTRYPTRNGLEAAKKLSTFLVKNGYIILSGLAEGIDAVGHQASVDHGAKTIAVLGHGIDVVFPAGTSGLRRKIVETGGAIVSEYLPRDSYNRERFVKRNRIQAALSKAVAIVEGKSKSGTAHTVRFARQLRRSLFGVRLLGAENIPEQELLNELINNNEPVFDLNSPTVYDQLGEFLGNITGIRIDTKKETPRLFSGLIEEIRRIDKDNNATDEDLAWLVQQIEKYRQHRGKKDVD